MYARHVVRGYGYKLDGWPEDIPFSNLSDIDGGAAPLKRLTRLWKAGTLRFVAASAEERWRALHDPDSLLPRLAAPKLLSPGPRPLVHPSSSPSYAVRRLRELAAAHPPPPAVSPSSVGQQRILHPLNLNPMFVLPDKTGSHPLERRQRSDVGRARFRPVSNPDSRPLRYRRTGPLTSLYVFDPSSSTTDSGVLEQPLQIDDPIEEFVEDNAGGEKSDDIEEWSD